MTLPVLLSHLQTSLYSSKSRQQDNEAFHPLLSRPFLEVPIRQWMEETETDELGNASVVLIYQTSSIDQIGIDSFIVRKIDKEREIEAGAERDRQINRQTETDRQRGTETEKRQRDHIRNTVLSVSLNTYQDGLQRKDRTKGRSCEKLHVLHDNNVALKHKTLFLFVMQRLC